MNGRTLLWAGLGVAGGLIAGFVAVGPNAQTALVVAALAGMILLARPQAALVLAAAALPVILSVRVAGQQVAMSDILLLAAVGGALLRRRKVFGVGDRRAALQAMTGSIAAYTVVGAVQAAALRDPYSVVISFSRATMLGVPLLAGLTFGRSTTLVNRALGAYVVVTCMVAAGWCVAFGQPALWGINKNPGAQMMVNAMIVLLVQKKFNPLYAIATTVLAAGVLATGSRGALLGLGVAIGAILLARFSSGWTWRRAAVLVAVVLAVLAVAPSSTTDRILAQDASGLYNLDIRGVYVADALGQAAENLAVGHGEGTYRPVDPALSRVGSLDPHNVWALQLFEGGLPLLLMFVLIALVSITVMWRRRRDWVCVAALAAELSVLVHSSVDIYWVRATPTFAFFLIGVGIARTAVRPHALERPEIAALATNPRMVAVS